MSSKTKYAALLLLLLLPLMLILLVFYSNTSEHLYAVVGLAQNVASVMTSQKRYTVEIANRNASTMRSEAGYITSVETQKTGDDGVTSVPICTSRERLDYIRHSRALGKRLGTHMDTTTNICSPPPPTLPPPKKYSADAHEYNVYRKLQRLTCYV